MKIGLIVASRQRPALLGEFLRMVQHQSRPPDSVVLSVVDTTDTPDINKFGLKATVLLGPPGSCVQRNRGIDYLRDHVDILAFLDDDFWMSRKYLAELERMFRDDQELVGVTGHVVADGATSKGYSVEAAEQIIARRESSAPPLASLRDVSDAYGCNMAFRSRAIDGIRFDERLPLYGWLEDVDFSAQLRCRGRLVWTDALWGVHLGTKLGKTSGLRFGYSQVANPLYVVNKGNLSAWKAVFLVLRNIGTNVVRSAYPEPYIDRRGRLRGNLLGLYDLVSGRADPERVLRL